MTFVIFAASGLISLYSKEIKDILHLLRISASRTGSRSFKAGIRNLIQQDRDHIQLLESLHNNSYNLLNYLALSFTSLFMNLLYTSLLFLLFLVAMRILFHRFDASDLSLLRTILVGITCGRIALVNLVLNDLWNYEKRTEERREANAALEEMLSREKPKD
ncbi:MAG: hypothetical protein WAK26_14850 [Terracidiphilus sp.]